jgi:Ser/Thr protein kinase RdoA (MazF antagonist)
MHNTKYNFKEVISRFKLDGEIKDIHPFGSGHINDTFRLQNADNRKPDYLLQRVNHTVFKDIPTLMENIRCVTEHIRKELENQRVADISRRVLTLVPSKNNKMYFKDTEGNFWRIYYFIEKTVSYDIVRTWQQANEGGRAFGQFQRWLSDFKPGILKDTIPDFHNIKKRYKKFADVIIADPTRRVKEVETEIEFVTDRINTMETILNNGEAGRIPLRITHNDTKFNNVLFDRNDRALCVIDLDTVMPGYLAYDFGDSIRTIVNTAAEDEKDLQKIDVNIQFFKAFTLGFIKETTGLLTKEEIELLPMGALLLPYIMGIRFLTDYLEGDVYYKIHSPGHNLQRARAQFQLLRRLEAIYPTLIEIVFDASEKYK